MRRVAVLLALALLTACSSNIPESRGEPHRGQVTNSQWSQTYLTVRNGGESRRVQPGDSTPRGATYARFCIPAGYTGTAYIATDDNPAGFPQTRVGGGSCHKLTGDAVASVTVSK